MTYYQLILFTLLCTFSIISSAEQLRVTYDNEVQVQIDGKVYHLNSGDIIDVQVNDGAKQNIKIIKTNISFLKNKKAVIWAKTFNDLKENNSFIPEISDTNNGLITIQKSLTVKTLTGSAQLSAGDKVRFTESEDKKQNIEIVESTTAPLGNAIIWKKTFEKYIEAGDVFDQSQTSSLSASELKESQALLDKLVMSLTQDDDADVDSTHIIKEDLSCPNINNNIKLLKGILVAYENDKENYLPAGTKVQTVKSDDGRCHLKILALPKGSKYSKSDFPRLLKTSPINLPDSNFEEIEYDENNLKLVKGLNFNFQKGQQLSAIGRRTGKRYILSPKDRIEIAGRHSNGSYIIKRNGKKWEYRVNASDLEQLNDMGLLNTNAQATVESIANGDMFNDTVEENTPEQPDCNDIDPPKDSHYNDNFSWQTCRTKSVVNKKGKVYKPNNYMENKIPISNATANKLLKNSDVNNFAQCINSSLKKGLNRNTNPSCKRDNKGKLKAERVRTAVYKKVNGKKKFSYWKLLRKAPRACASKKLSTHLADQFLKAAKCVNVDPKEIFPIINHESHFQPGAVSHTFAMGVGQIVPDNYLAFYNSLKSAKRFIKKSPKRVKKMQTLNTPQGYKNFEQLPSSKKVLSRYPSFFATELHDQMTKRNNPNCKELYNIIDKPFTVPRWAKENSSKLYGYLRSREHERLCAPQNPSEGFFISMIYYKMNKKYANYLLTRKDMGLSKKQINDFSIILSRWMYNGGSAGASNRFKVLLDLIKDDKVPKLNSKGERVKKNGVTQRRKNVKLSNFTNDELKKYMKFLLNDYYPSKSKARRKEVANYVPGDIKGQGGIDGDLKATEEKGSLACGNSY